MPDDICYLSATEATKLFREKKLSPVELAKAVIGRAEQLNEKLKFFTYTRFDEALAKAKVAERKYVKGQKTGPLEGLLVGIKDENWIEGWNTSFGSLIKEGYVCDHTTVVNQRIMDAGGIVHARTTTPEWSITPYTNSKMWGVTRNPWNPEFTPGGSSGGSSSSLAAGASTLATASDIGGSIRIPASVTGLIGFMPPHGRNPDDPPFYMDPYIHNGPLARSVQDAILLQNVMSGPHPSDLASLKPKFELPTKYRSIKGMRIAYSPNLDYFTVSKEVLKNTEAALDILRGLGAIVEEVTFGWTKDSYVAAAKHMNHIFGGQMNAYMREHRKIMSRYAIDFAEQGGKSTPDDYLWSQTIQCQMYEKWSAVMEKFDVLIAPTTAIPAVPADFDHSVSGRALRIDGKDPKLEPPMLNWVLTTPFNTMSRIPVLAMPSGFAKNGVPTGIQIAAKTYEDDVPFRVGVAYEKAMGGWYNAKNKRPDLTKI